jgi:hypothetical protein
MADVTIELLKAHFRQLRLPTSYPFRESMKTRKSRKGE